PPLATCHRCWEIVQRINKQVLHRWAATESGREFLCELEQLVTSAQNVTASHVEETEVVDSLKKPRKKRDTPYLDLGNAIHKRFEQVLRGNYEYDIAVKDKRVALIGNGSTGVQT